MASVQEWHVTAPYIASKCDLGEGPFYIPERHELRFLDINKHKLFILDLARGPDSLTIADTHMPLGVTADIEGVDSSEIILCGAKDGITKFHIKTGKHEYVAKYWVQEQGRDVAAEKTRIFRSNDGAVDSTGRFWVGVMVDPELADVTDDDVLLVLGPDGALPVKHQGAKIPNGLSWSLDDKTMYFTASPIQHVYAFDYEKESGRISGKRVFFHVEEDGVFPDGHAMDVRGNIWQALYGGSRVVRISPEGKVTGTVHLPTRNITCCVFGGTELFITSAKEKEVDRFPESAKFGGNVFRVNVGVEGVPKHKARLSV